MAASCLLWKQPFVPCMPRSFPHLPSQHTQKCSFKSTIDTKRIAQAICASFPKKAIPPCTKGYTGILLGAKATMLDVTRLTPHINDQPPPITHWLGFTYHSIFIVFVHSVYLKAESHIGLHLLQHASVVTGTGGSVPQKFIGALPFVVPVASIFHQR